MHIYKMKNTKNVKNKPELVRVSGEQRIPSVNMGIYVYIDSEWLLYLSIQHIKSHFRCIPTMSGIGILKYIREELTKFIIKLKDILDPDDVIFIFFFSFSNGVKYMVAFIISNRHSHSFHVYIYI